MHNVLKSCCLAAACLTLLTACGTATLENAWKGTVESTEELYTEYINTDPTIDLKSAEEDEDEWHALGKLMMPVDIRIESLTRYLAGRDSFPDDKWVGTLFNLYPWLSGIVTVDTEGEIIAKKTLVPLKPIDAKPFLEIGDAWQDRRLRGRYEMTPLGPEIYLGIPFFKENEWVGLTVVHFDMAPLLKACPDPSKLVIMTEEDLLWSGGYASESLPKPEEPWKEVLATQVSGELDAGDRGEMLWVARYLGDFRLIYATFIE